eukprot:scaffold1318_cov106-Isochrysis_galbana.AAC.2
MSRPEAHVRHQQLPHRAATPFPKRPPHTHIKQNTPSVVVYPPARYPPALGGREGGLALPHP